jgi:peroxiredoxin
MIRIIYLIFFTLIFCLTDEELLEIKAKTEVDPTAPDFTLNSLTHETLEDNSIEFIESEINLYDLKGKLVLLNFWATWCGPCLYEIPDLNELHEIYNHRGLEILGISISDNGYQLKKFKKQRDIKYPLLFDNPQEMQSVTEEYGGIYSIPISILIDTSSQIIRVYNSAILKDHDFRMYADLISYIEANLPTSKIDESLNE